MADIVLVNPRFALSYWGLEHALPLLGKRGTLPPAGLPLLAALTPRTHRVTIVDENVEAIDFDRLARADIVGMTGMTVQRARMREILVELKRRGVFVVVGGPWVTVEERYFGALADVVFVGEAEETWPRFLAEWERGRHAGRYEQAQKTDMSTVPTPRYDLLDMRAYAFGSVQFSRGCPFLCEFCDIIVTFGRRPRLKRAAQIIDELAALRRAGMRIAFIVDDNLIGNKKAVAALLREIADWQREHGYPLMFFTEASLDLAEDAELMALMVEANVACVFVGIESTNEASLVETRKLQNVRKRGGSLLDKVRAIQDAGIEVWCGMIVGFDHDDASVFEAQREFVQRARIVHATIGMLSAIPKTPLHARLALEGRLDPADPPEYGTNVIPAGMSRAELRDGYVRLMRELYAAEPYFARLEALYLDGALDFARARNRYFREHPWARRRSTAENVAAALYLFQRLMRLVPDAALRREYGRRLLRVLRVRPDPEVLVIYLVKCATHYHYDTMAREMAAGGTPYWNTF